MSHRMARIVHGALIFLALYSPSPARADTYASEQGLRASDPLLYAHVVIECTITELVTRQVTLEDLGIRDMPGVTTLVKEAMFSDLRVLRGAYEESSILIDLNALDNIQSDALVGTRMILCGNWKPKLGRYVVRSSRSVFIQSEPGWQRVFRNETISRAEVDQLLQTVQPDMIATRADVALIGRVVSCEKTRVELTSGRSASAWSVALDVQRKLKGRITDEKISFILLISGDYIPEWRGEDPKEFLPGETWLVFLAERDGFLVPVSGKNGLLLVDGNKLTYDRSVPYALSLSRFETLVTDAENENQR